MKTFKITVNNREIDAVSGETILTALRREGIDIPTLCHIDGLSPTGACRICLVELKGDNSLVPSCSFHVFENMKISTHSQKAINARKTANNKNNSLITTSFNSFEDHSLCAGNFHLKSQYSAPSAMVCVRTRSTPNSRAAQ